MAVTTQASLATQMIQQLRLLDPSISAEVGTPERKILDTVAQSLYDSQVDLSALQGALDVDAKYGAALDRLLALFGFSRQKSTYATGYVTFSRTTPSTSDIRIPAGTICYASVQGNADQEAESTNVQSITLYEGILPAGELSVVVPVRSQIAGSIGNLAAGRITSIVGTTAYGITSITNETALTGGQDAETDDEYKVRFKNTLFRNLAGTEDQYLALAVATSYTSKANVVGPQSFYREYIQVPDGPDNSFVDVDGSGNFTLGNGSAGQYTTALSSLPYAKAIYQTGFPVFVTSGEPTATSIFYRPDVDFTFNVSNADRNRGDAYRFAVRGLDNVVGSVEAQNRPNFTFLNVYTGQNADITAVRPQDIVLVEYSYLSDASRNNIALNITNAVDVYIDGGNDVTASTIIVRPTSSTAFSTDSNSKFYHENYRRIGEPNRRPTVGNILTPMYWQPVEDLPDYIMVGTVTYFKNINYWPVSDVSSIGSTIRGRSGIEWSTRVKGKAATDVSDDPTTWSGKIITDSTGDVPGGAPIEIKNYTYDRNIPDLQSSLDGSKQVTTDVLAHKAKTRWFKFDISVMYESGFSQADVNVSIQSAVDQFLKSQYFGSPIQLSDILQVIHNVSGVDNVRWTSDIPGFPDLQRVFETDRDGNSLMGIEIERIQKGSGGGTPEVQRVYIRGTNADTTGSYVFSYTDVVGATLTLTSTEASIESAISSVVGATVDVTTVLQSTDPKDPYFAYDASWTASGADLLKVSYDFENGPFTINSDWMLKDNEQARLAESTQLGDTLPGLIIRPRAANTWVRGK